MIRSGHVTIGAAIALLAIEGSSVEAAVPDVTKQGSGGSVWLAASSSFDDTQAYQVAGKGPKPPRPARAAKPKPPPKAKAKPKGVSGAAKRLGGKIKQTAGRAVEGVKKGAQKTKAALSQARATASAALRRKTAPTQAQTAQQKPANAQSAARKPVSLLKKRSSFQANQYGSKGGAGQKTSRIPTEKKASFQKPAGTSGRAPSAVDPSNKSKKARDWRKQVSQRYGTKSQFKTTASQQNDAAASSGTRGDQAKPSLERKDWQQTSPGGQGQRRNPYPPATPPKPPKP